MRITLTIDDRLLQAIRRKAAERDMPLKSFIDEALRRGLEAMGSRPAAQPYHTRVYPLGLRPGIDPDRVAHAAQESEDEEAIQTGCTLHTTDTDFARFPGLSWKQP